MDEITPITPQHVLSHLKMAGATVAKRFEPSSGYISPSRRLPGQRTRSAGWYTEKVDRTGRPALTIKGRVITPAEAVMLKYDTNGYDVHAKRRDEETPGLVEHLKSQGLSVVPHEGRSFLITRPAQ